MRIAILAPLRFPIAEPYYGGLEMHTHLLGQELLRQGHEVTLFAHPDSDPSFNLQPIGLAENANFIEQSFAFGRAMRGIVDGNFDVVHNNSIHYLPPLSAGKLFCRMVTTLHTPPYKALRWGGRITRSANHTFVSISAHLHEVWRPYIGQHEVVHNGLDGTKWPLNLQPEPGTAVWYGRFTPEKGAEYAIAAAQRAGYRLTLAGPVYDEGYFAQKIRPELGGNITYAGHLNQTDLAELIGRSAVGLVTSVWEEPFGLVYVEMPACGTPVAAFASGAATEVVLPETGTIVAKRDTVALAQVLGKLSGHDRQKCRQAALAKFSLQRMVEGYLQLYRS
ncbi:MAG: glycosyltransferase [Bacteroidota bacterium]